MTTTRKALLTAALAMTIAMAAPGADVDRLPGNKAATYTAIKPIESEQKWKGIPWMTKLDEAVQVAAREKRPVCIWVVDNEPLDRC